MINETALTAIIGSILSAIPATIIAWATLKQGRANAEKAQEINVKTDQIHTLTNSSLAKVQSALAVANEKIEGLEKLVGQMSATAKKNPRPTKGRD